MASTFTTNKSIEKPANGDYVNTWSTPVNSDWDIIDTSLGGTTTINATGASGTVTLSTSQYRPPTIIITGVLTSNVTYRIPSGVGGHWVIYNNTSGAFTITIDSGGGGTSTTVAQGFRVLVYSDGTNIGPGITSVPLAAAGASGQVQYNSSGSLAGSSNLTYDGSGNLVLGGVTPGRLDVRNAFRIYGSTSGYFGLTVLAAAGSTTYTLPNADGTSGQALTTNGSGTLSWTTVSGGVAGVTSFSAGTTGLTPAAASTGAVVLAGTLSTANGGTGSSSTTYCSLTSNVTGTLPVANGGTGLTATPSNGQVDIGNGTGFTRTTLTAGSGVSITNGAGSITIAATGSGGTVTSVSGTGTVNGITLTGTVTSTGNLTLGGTLSGVSLATQVTGTLPVANGGTGQTTYTNGQLLIGNTTGNTLTKATLTAGTGISITNGTGSITIANGLTGSTTTTLTSLGIQTAQSLTSGTGNTFVGYIAGIAATTGNYNSFFGSEAGASATTGSQNTAIGHAAGYSITTGSNNTAIGYYALFNPSTAADNTAIGHNAGLAVTSGYSNVFIGKNSGDSVTTGYYNVTVGATAGTAITSGYENSLVGYGAGDTITSGVSNSMLGKWSGIDISSGSYNTGVGQLALGNALVNCSNSSALGYNAQVTGSDQVQLGNGSTTTYAYGAVQNRSDSRDKADIADTDLGLDFVMALRPRKFRWDMREDYKTPRPAPGSSQQEIDAWKQANAMSALTHDGTYKRTRFHQGLIAQEVKQVMDQMGVDFGGYQDHKIKGGEDVLSIGYEEMIPPLIKAIQELKAEFDEYKRTHP